MAAVVAVVGCSLSDSFSCSASGASIADLATNVKQIPVSISIVSYAGLTGNGVLLLAHLGTCLLFLRSATDRTTSLSK